MNSKASYTSTLVTNNLELKAKHLKFVLVPAVNQHLLKSLPPLDFMRKIGGSCLIDDERFKMLLEMMTIMMLEMVAT